MQRPNSENGLLDGSAVVSEKELQEPLINFDNCTSSENSASVQKVMDSQNRCLLDLIPIFEKKEVGSFWVLIIP